MSNPLIPAVSVHDGKPVTTSLVVAEHFGKRHADVLRDIDALLAQVPDSFDKRNFAPSERDVRVGLGFTRRERYFELTRDAFTLLAMGFTGAEALRFKIAFLDAFNQMEAALSSDSEAARLRAELAALHQRLAGYEARLLPRVPALALDYQGQAVHWCVLDGQPLLLAADLATIARAAGVVVAPSYEVDGRTCTPAIPTPRVLKRLGLHGTGLHVTGMGALVRAWQVSSPTVCRALGLTVGHRRMSFITVLGLAALAGPLPEFYAWCWRDALPQLPATARRSAEV